MDLPKKKRVRARLDHMTPEEKQERRKEKNRQAAQTARDRKRDRLERLEEENQRLREENMRLRCAILGNIHEPLFGANCSTTPSQSTSTPLRPPVIQVTDSGVSDVDSRSATSMTSSYMGENNHMSPIDGGSDGRTATPDSASNYETSGISPAPSDENLINSIMERDNDIALVNEVQSLVSYVNGDAGEDVSIESAALINGPQQQVRDMSAASSLPENSLGWTSVQLMLILMISRIHHRLSARINCCQRAHTKTNGNDEMDPINSNLYDYILHTKCVNFRRAAETIISNKNNIRHQRLIALDFVQKYLYHTNLIRQNHNNNSPAQGTTVQGFVSQMV